VLRSGRNAYLAARLGQHLAAADAKTDAAANDAEMLRLMRMRVPRRHVRTGLQEHVELERVGAAVADDDALAAARIGEHARHATDSVAGPRRFFFLFHGRDFKGSSLPLTLGESLMLRDSVNSYGSRYVTEAEPLRTPSCRAAGR